MFPRRLRLLALFPALLTGCADVTRPVANSDAEIRRPSDTPAAAARVVAHVPRDFATIQDAVDNSTATTILVAAGRHLGARVTRRVELIANGQAVIDQGVEVEPGRPAGFILLGGGSGSVIRGFVFDNVMLAIFASCRRLGSVADDVVVEHNTFVNNAQGITVADADCAGGDGWIIQYNRFRDIRADISNCGGGLGVFLSNVDRAVVLHNRFRGTLREPPCGSLFSTAAVFLTGSDDSHVILNDVELDDGGQAFKFDVALFGFQPGGGANRNTVVANNDLRQSDAPFFGIHVASFDGSGLSAQCNFGTTFIADGDRPVELFTESDCRRRDIRPDLALARPNVGGAGIW